MNTNAYVYLLLCRDGTLYCGWTTDPSARLRAHNSGCGSKYTRTRLPVRMVYCEKIDGGKSEALRREYEIKHMTRRQKLALINKSDNIQ
ncbi:MAG: GIY-YIG nuclease family protein [Christensenellaceae bacterium]|nr:GIY-YIG nuclease family protein [Christensenellaceae bacterium]